MGERCGGIILSAVLAAATCVAQSRGVEMADGLPWTVVGTGLMDVAVLRGDAPLFILHGNVVGPGWKGGRLSNLAEAVEGGARVFTEEKVGFYSWGDKEPVPGLFDLNYELSQVGPNAFRMRYVCVPDSDTTFGFPKNVGEKSVTVGPALRPALYFRGGTCTIAFADGRTQDRPMPVSRSADEDVASVTLKTASGEVTRMVFDPPLFVHCDHSELRVFSGCKTDVKAGETFTQDITLELPRPAAFEPANRYVDMSDWFALDMTQAGDFSTPSILGMEEWLDGPAGKHGFVQVKGKDFVFEDGTQAKFWGVNQCVRLVCPEPEDAVRWADKWAKHGVNLVRMHKFIGHGWRDSGIHDNDDTQKRSEERRVGKECSC